MFTLIISIIIGCIAGYFSYLEYELFWGLFIGLLAAIGAHVVISLLIRRKTKKFNDEIQALMQEAQNKINRKIQAFQRKPQSGIKAMQKTIESEQTAAVTEALTVLDKFKPFYHWNFLLKKQIITMRMMFNYQIKNFKEVDKLMPSCMMLDPQAVAFKMARQYKNNEDFLQTFKKKIKKFKGERAVLLYAACSWMLVKQKNYDEAINVLVEGKNKTGNETIASNWEAIANGRYKKFSNAKLGDLWYALYLEQPQAMKQQRMRQKMGKGHF